MKTKLFDKIAVGNTEVKNRMVVPPMVCFGYSDETGRVTEANLSHYEALAAGGAGLIIVEATCIVPSGRLSLNQLGLWEDEQIEGMKKIAEVCHKNDAKVMVQIHHAGRSRSKSLNEVPFDLNTLTLGEIKEIQEAYVTACKRAEVAGFDGIEFHGAHGYLMSQWASPEANQREDQYGGSLENRLRFASEVIQQVKKECNFNILGYRMGGNEPELAEGIEIAKALEKMGVDLLHVSAGIGGGALPEVPEDFPGNWIVYMGTAIKKEVNMPVIAVNSIRKLEDITKLIDENAVDFVALGRPHLVDPMWTTKTQKGELPIECLNCKPCKWFKNGKDCPRVIERG